MRKAKKPLSNQFPRVETTSRGWLNLTRSQRVRIAQTVLIMLAFMAGGGAMVHMHIPLCAAALAAMVGAFLLEGYRH